MKPPIKILLLHAQTSHNSTLSYQTGWPKHFQNHSKFKCIAINVYDNNRLARFRASAILKWKRFDAVVILHSAFSNTRYLKGPLYNTVCSLPHPKAYFIGNEFMNMPEKMRFSEELGISLLVTMNPNTAAQALYRERLGCEITCIPSGGLDTDIFFPTTDWKDRPIDIGYRCYEAPLILGHNERGEIADIFQQRKTDYGFTTDISMDYRDRFDTEGWAGFLNRCKCQLGTEAGGDYFELTNNTINKVRTYMEINPRATLPDVFDRFFKDYPNPTPVRTISGRHVEAAGTKTAQILFDGYYNGYFQPDVHYIPLRKDFSNMDEAVTKLRDESFCRQITNKAYETVVQELTYAKLIDRFYEAFAAFV